MQKPNLLIKGICLRFSNAGWDLLQGKLCQLKNKNQTCDSDPET